MDKVLVAKLGVEGGGCSIYGREAVGSWSFWQEGSSLDLDENDEEVVRSWTTEPVPDLGLAMPKEWPLYHLLKVQARPVAGGDSDGAHALTMGRGPRSAGMTDSPPAWPLARKSIHRQVVHDLPD